MSLLSVSSSTRQNCRSNASSESRSTTRDFCYRNTGLTWVADSVIVEVKAVERFDAIHTAQMLTYLRVAGLRVGLVLNFNSAVLTHGIRRVIL